MSGNVIPYFIPLLPLLSCAILMAMFPQQMAAIVRPEFEADRGRKRAMILILAGFSYSGLLGLALLSTATTVALNLPIYFLLVSFLSFYLAQSLQRHAHRRWHDHLCEGLIDSGSLSLILSVLSVILFAPFSRSYRIGISLGAFMVWYADHVLRIWVTARRLGNAAEESGMPGFGAGNGYRRGRSSISDTIWYVLKGYKSE
jgi:hypothetical protein